jgi:hypothetical protein
MSQAQRIYAIRVRGAAPIFALVRAPSAARALAHHARGMYEVEVASQEDLVFGLGELGLRVVQATNRSEDEAPPTGRATGGFTFAPDELETPEIEDAAAAGEVAP